MHQPLKPLYARPNSLILVRLLRFIVAIAAWAVGIAVSFYNGNRKLPLIVLAIGLGLMFAPVGAFGIAGIAVLAAIIWIANKADLS